MKQRAVAAVAYAWQRPYLLQREFRTSPFVFDDEPALSYRSSRLNA